MASLKSVLNQRSQGTGIAIPDYANGEKIVMDGTAKTCTAHTAGVWRLENRTGDVIYYRGDGTAAVSAAAGCIVVEVGAVEAAVSSHAGNTISIIGASGTGYVHLMPVAYG